MRVLIVEDETLIAENLAMIVRSCGSEVVDIVEEEKGFLEAVLNKEVDLALLDIRLNGEDLGLKFAEMLREYQVPFIFITSFSDKRLLMQATSLRPYGYILKPFSRNDIANELERLEQELGDDFIVLKTGTNSQVKMKKSEICFLNSENVYVNVVSEEDRVVVRGKLIDFCKEFKKGELVRVHQSYAVNPSCIKRISDSEIELQNKERIPVSRKYQSDLKNVLREFE